MTLLVVENLLELVLPILDTRIWGEHVIVNRDEPLEDLNVEDEEESTEETEGGVAGHERQSRFFQLLEEMCFCEDDFFGQTFCLSSYVEQISESFRAFPTKELSSSWFSGQ